MHGEQILQNIHFFSIIPVAASRNVLRLFPHLVDSIMAVPQFLRQSPVNSIVKILAPQRRHHFGRHLGSATDLTVRYYTVPVSSNLAKVTNSAMFHIQIKTFNNETGIFMERKLKLTIIDCH